MQKRKTSTSNICYIGEIRRVVLVPEASFFFHSAASTIESWLSFPIKYALIPNLLIFFTFYFDIQDGFWYEVSAYDAYRSEENKVGGTIWCFQYISTLIRCPKFSWVDQGHLEAGGDSAAANCGIQVNWGNQIGSKTRGGSQQDQEAYNILCIFVLVTCVDGVMIS